MTYSITTKEGKYTVVDAKGVEQMAYVHQEQFAKECLRKQLRRKPQPRRRKRRRRSESIRGK